jgi:hypothetical protein
MQTSLAHSRWLACYFNWRDVFLDVAATSDDHVDEADCDRNYAVRMSAPRPRCGKSQGTRYFYLFSDSNSGAHGSRVSRVKGTPVGVKRPGREADHCADGNSEWSNNFTTHIWLHDVYRNYYTLLWLCEIWSMFNNIQKNSTFLKVFISKIIFTVCASIKENHKIVPITNLNNYEFNI